MHNFCVVQECIGDARTRFDTDGNSYDIMSQFTYNGTLKEQNSYVIKHFLLMYILDRWLPLENRSYWEIVCSYWAISSQNVLLQTQCLKP